MINSKHLLALRYNDISVLENHHAATLFQILGLEGCDIFESFSSSERSYLRKVMIPTILATDMAKHKQVMDHFRSVITEFSKEDENHRQGLMDMILHSSDVGNPAFKFELATVWSLKIVQEFNEQVWKEEQYKIPVSEFLRIGNDIQNIKKSQIGFICKLYAAFFIQPLWELLAEHVEEAREYVDCIIENRIKWEQVQRL